MMPDKAMVRVASEALIYRAIAACMADISAVGKVRRNSVQGYNFRGIDDVYNELHGVLAKHGVFTVPSVLEDRTEDRTTGKGSALIYRVLKMNFVFYASDGSSVTACVIGEGMDSGDKASNKAMAVAHKYALMQIFCIPTEEAKDPENDSHEVKSEKAPEQNDTQSQGAPTYNGTPEQRADLEWELRDRNVPPSLWDAVSLAMQGQPMRKTSLNTAIVLANSEARLK